MRQILLLLTIIVNFSCAEKKHEDPYIRCAVFFKFDENNHRYNGFWDYDRQREVNVSECDEINPTSR